MGGLTSDRPAACHSGSRTSEVPAGRAYSMGGDACGWAILERYAPANWPEFVLVEEALTPRRRAALE